METVQAAKSAGNSRLEALQGVKAALSVRWQAGRLAEDRATRKRITMPWVSSFLRKPVFEIRTAVRADGGEGQYTDRKVITEYSGHRLRREGRGW
ncbi:hypothetical protein ACLBOM_08625 [Escherichia coli]